MVHHVLRPGDTPMAQYASLGVRSVRPLTLHSGALAVSAWPLTPSWAERLFRSSQEFFCGVPSWR